MPDRALALVGAFERDNFGDLLFPIVARRYVSDPVVLAAPLRGTTERVLGARIQTYADLAIGDASPQGVWVVGGELGGQRPFQAMAHHPDFTSDGFVQRTWPEVLEAGAGATGLSRHSQAYIPRMSAFESTMRVPCAVNSVGLRNIKELVGCAALEARGALAEASYVSVRDAASAALLARLGVDHILAPDMIHTIAGHFSFGVDPADLPYALVQINQRDLEAHGAESVARELAGSKNLAGFAIRLFVAGLAPGHESLDGYRDLRAALTRLMPGRSVDILTDPDPLAKVRVIAGASLWVGASLHGAVISAAYGVPRVSLANPKVSTYHRTWDERMPFDVGFGDVDDACGAALQRAGLAEEVERGAHLAALAETSARAAAAAVAGAVSADELARRVEMRARMLAIADGRRQRLIDRLEPSYMSARFRAVTAVHRVRAISARPDRSQR